MAILGFSGPRVIPLLPLDLLKYSLGPFSDLTMTFLCLAQTLNYFSLHLKTLSGNRQKMSEPQRAGLLPL